MAGIFEVFMDSDELFRFRLKAPDGTVMAVSGAFPDKPAVKAGIDAVRECAGTGLVADLSGAAVRTQPEPVPAASVPAVVQPACEETRMPVERLRAFAHSKASRRPVTPPRWTGAA